MPFPVNTDQQSVVKQLIPDVISQFVSTNDSNQSERPIQSGTRKLGQQLIRETQFCAVYRKHVNQSVRGESTPTHLKTQYSKAGNDLVDLMGIVRKRGEIANREIAQSTSENRIGGAEVLASTSLTRFSQINDQSAFRVGAFAVKDSQHIERLRPVDYSLLNKNLALFEENVADRVQTDLGVVTPKSSNSPPNHETYEVDPQAQHSTHTAYLAEAQHTPNWGGLNHVNAQTGALTPMAYPVVDQEEYPLAHAVKQEFVKKQ